MDRLKAEERNPDSRSKAVRKAAIFRIKGTYASVSALTLFIANRPVNDGDTDEGLLFSLVNTDGDGGSSEDSAEREEDGESESADEPFEWCVNDVDDDKGDVAEVVAEGEGEGESGLDTLGALPMIGLVDGEALGTDI